MSIMEQPTHIVCPKCGMVSHNPHDIQQRYCGHCRAFHDDLMREMPSGSTFYLPETCFSCGAYLMGGATEHKEGCEVRKLIEDASR